MTKNKSHFLCVLIFTLLLILSWKQENLLYSTTKGTVKFVSEAPLELIEAESNELSGILSSENQTFAFSVPINSFIGFNSPLQEEHFNENYLESEKYSKATFTGSIIEEVDILNPGEIIARAKGKFTIHGVEKVQMMEVLLKISDDEIIAETTFEILLEDYQIDIPRIVNKKIAETISVNVYAVLHKK